MSLSAAREAISSSGAAITFPEVYASIARRASSPAETPSRRLISRSFFTLLRGTRYCWRMRSSDFADIPNSCALTPRKPRAKTVPGSLHIHNRIHNRAQVTETHESPQLAFRRRARLEEGMSGTTVGRLELCRPFAYM